MTELRPLTASDYEQASALWAAAEGLGAAETASGYARFLARNEGLSQAAVDADGRLVGAILCGHDGRRGFVYRLAVASSARRQGLATRLVERALAALRAEGIERVLVFVYRSNEAAVAFWQRAHARLREDLHVLARDL